MNSEKLKVPLKEDGNIAWDFENVHRRKKSHKIQFIVGICFFFTLVTALFIITMFTLSCVKRLEKEIDYLKAALGSVRILDDDLISAINGFEEEDLYPEDEEPLDRTEIFIETPDDSDEYVEYENYDQPVFNSSNGIHSTSKIKNGNQIQHNRDNDKLEANLTSQEKAAARRKRTIVASTDDGVLINSESYAEKKAKNDTRNKMYTTKGISIKSVSAKSSPMAPWISPRRYYDNTATPNISKYRKIQVKQAATSTPVYIRKSRVMHHEDKSKAFRQVVKKSSLKSGDTFPNSNEQTSSSEASFTIVRDDGTQRRRYRQRHLNLETLDERHPKVGRIKPLPSVHYSGDTSRYVVGQHTNFNGNGHLRHLQRTFVDWKASDWVKSTGMESHFTMEDGVLTIKEAGLYFVYSQIYYLDEHDTTGFRVHKNGEMILQCTITAHSTERRLKGNTCYTAGVEHLSGGDNISLADVTEGRYSLFEPGKSFFGVIKLGDVKVK